MSIKIFFIFCVFFLNTSFLCAIQLSDSEFGYKETKQQKPIKLLIKNKQKH